ncbi:MAG TPA: TetR/AcrR family transcriptional regulator [Hungateiclostridium thermocellum]|jgi:TetR/AcrR family transcriptional regulator|uniref:Transcriptional regulator, TetR family n=2 Tax=Acetivibrio thermocellus TaxID=1515 RepID=A3DK56_ACET2|nr:TetR/AcrR family transcriptional regulator [Acetivibrio thermocellus]CDG37621.1 TetR family transcriptional regulator [Acetivibrio thermocellus BC1]ABN54335.1 transcriptional regulator, TetR family [Acetivibrio thermocellus ATCC 27405]ADU73771.1 transcriptional regulator, TetR family [Acetivibrio thermocellus DSM 1313]ALX07702.1 transcriptional regulator, TetR family [Acetivibrio thermocellus AD2]ANV75444.1 transcriptional regulator, TetR family [Acetivibrio thermocellus DSM 2360]
MPKETFFNLPKDKRNLIISAAMDEFSKAGYNTASINQICKKSNIPKGSFYQYFTDKLDLYVYIMTLTIEEKIKFFSSAIAEFHTLTFLEQFRLLFLKGLEFAKKHPQYAALADQFSKEDNESVKSAVIKEGDKQAESLFMQMIHNAKTKGEIDSKVDSLALCLLLQSLNSAVNKYMIGKFGGISYEYNQEDINNFVDSLLDIIFSGIQNKAD